MIAENVTAPRQLSSLDEALINQTSYVYIAAEFDDTAPLNIIELGDGKYYGRYLNRPLVPGLCYKVAIRILYSEVKYCVTVLLEIHALFYRTVNILHTAS